MRMQLWSAAVLMALCAAANAQSYHPDAFGRPGHSLQLERDALRMDAFRASRNPADAVKRSDDRPEPWTMFSRLGNYALENHPGRPEDGVSLRRGSGPRIGTLSFGLRRKF